MSISPRDAATVMLVRDAVNPSGGPAVEVCMLRRNLESEFVAGVYVFPGGSVDPEDRDPAAEAVCRGRTDAEASALLGLPAGGLAFWVAALRECFEESGVLLAVTSGSGPAEEQPLDTRSPSVAARFAAHRDALNQGRTGILDVCRAENLRLATDGVFYVSHWITPDLAPRRYDTRFFVAVAPEGQTARHDDGETIATKWIRPADALDQESSGAIQLLPPTVANLRAIAGFTSTAEVMAWAAAITDIPTIFPIVKIEDDRVVILRPGDAGYDEALAARNEALG
jgi:8-oxo-dGTP pyrophosphatase MutT (NUDIX family)